jgi:hypothetical protein
MPVKNPRIIALFSKSKSLAIFSKLNEIQIKYYAFGAIQIICDTFLALF